MAIDVAELEAELQRLRRKAQDWASTRTQLATERRDHHSACMRDQTGKLQNLKGLKEDLRVATEQTRNRLKGEQRELSSLQNDLTGATAGADTAEKRLGKVQVELRRLREEYQQRIAELEGSQRRKQEQLDKIRRFVSMFADRFSLQFRHGQDELCLAMTHVDADDHAKEFYLSVRIRQDGVYEVTRCEPLVANLDELTAEVNRTNNFAAFVKGVRNGFVQVAKEAH